MTGRHGRAGGGLLLLPILVACSGAGALPGPAPGAGAAGPYAVTGAGVAGGAHAGDVASDYVIGPGDRLGVFVYGQPQLTLNDVPVRPDGRVSTPLAADVPAAGKTPSQLSGELARRLATYVRDPNVTVIVRDFVGPFDRQIRVIGEAADPQAIAYRDHMTLLDVMIATRGLTRFAAGNSAVIIRAAAGPGAPGQRIPVRLSDLLKDGDISANVEMRPGDTLIVPQSWF